MTGREFYLETWISPRAATQGGARSGPRFREDAYLDQLGKEDLVFPVNSIGNHLEDIATLIDKFLGEVEIAVLEPLTVIIIEGAP